jgi:hypothetical protein
MDAWELEIRVRNGMPAARKADLVALLGRDLPKPDFNGNGPIYSLPVDETEVTGLIMGLSRFNDILLSYSITYVV